MEKRVFPADLDAFQEASLFVEDFLERENVKMGAIATILIAVEEIFVNIARYAYPDEEGEMSLSVEINEGSCEIIFEDSGIPFNPLNKLDPDVTESAEERKIGGLGIYMVKKSMDNVIYSFENNKNILKLIKKI